VHSVVLLITDRELRDNSTLTPTSRFIPVRLKNTPPDAMITPSLASSSSNIPVTRGATRENTTELIADKEEPSMLIITPPLPAAPLAVVHVMIVSFTTLTLVHGRAATVISVLSVFPIFKSVPIIDTKVPPSVGPLDGEIPVITGTAYLNCPYV
jgi:hypothetical protein